jgi:hypothetical protein
VDSQFHPKPAALAFLGFHTDMTAHPLDDFAHDGQADAGAFPVGAGSFEYAEDALLVMFGNADAVVLDPQADCVTGGRGVTTEAVAPDANPRPGAGFGELDGVAQEIGEALSQRGFIAENGG